MVRGGRTPLEPWRIGIVDPNDRTRVILTLEADDLAVATSGRSERGEHVVLLAPGMDAHVRAEAAGSPIPAGRTSPA